MVRCFRWSRFFWYSLYPINFILFYFFSCCYWTFVLNMCWWMKGCRDVELNNHLHVLSEISSLICRERRLLDCFGFLLKKRNLTPLIYLLSWCTFFLMLNICNSGWLEFCFGKFRKGENVKFKIFWNGDRVYYLWHLLYCTKNCRHLLLWFSILSFIFFWFCIFGSFVWCL